MLLESERPRSFRALGNKLTGGGFRALTRRVFGSSTRLAMNNPVILTFGRTLLKPFPVLATGLYQLVSEEGHLNRPPDLDALSASARIVYERLQAASTACGAWNGTKREK